MTSLSSRVSVEPLDRALLDGVHEFEGAPERVRLELAILPVFSDERPLLGLAGLIDWRGSGRISAMVRSGFCTATVGEQVLVPCDGRLPVDRLVLVGLGECEKFNDVQARALAHQLVKISAGLQAQSVLIALPIDGIDRALVEAMFEGLLAAIAAPVPEDPAENPGEGPTLGPQDSAELAVVDEGEGAPLLRSDRESTARAEPEGAQPPAALDSHDAEAGGSVLAARWWVAVDEAVVARLRRVLSGPPRAARDGASLHT